MEILVPKFESYLEGYMFHAQTLCSLGEISEQPSRKLENVVSTILKTINNINIVFYNYFQGRSKFAFFSPWMMYWFEK